MNGGPDPDHRCPTGMFTDASYLAFRVAVVEHVCAILPEMGNTAVGAVRDGIAENIRLLKIAPRPKES